MGRVKEWLEERQQRGYADAPDDLAVCPQHVEDAYLKSQLEGDDDDPACSYCEDPSVHGAPLEVLVELVGGALHRFYETATNAGVPWDGEWVYPVEDTYDVVWELCADGGIDDAVAEQLVELFDDESWVAAHEPAEAPDVPLRRGWEAFCHYVKHQSRFLLMQPLPDVDDPFVFEEAPFDPHAVLTQIADVIDRVALAQLPAGTALYRARDAEEPDFSAITDFTSPPEHLASQGRMNPAGIPMFYGALEPETAAAEVYRGLPLAAVATFYPVRDLDVVDLTRVPRRSLFDPGTAPTDVYITRFLDGFIDDISKPIIHDDRVHREYIPTQVFTEYLRYRLLPAPAGLAGILFPSSVHPGGTNVVVFVGQSGCLHDNELGHLARTEEQILRCNTAEYTTYRFDPPRPIQPRLRSFEPDKPVARRADPPARDHS